MTAEADRNDPSIPFQPHGWALFPVAANLMPGGASALLAALQEERLKASLLIRPRPEPHASWLRRDSIALGVDGGNLFEIATRYWTTDNARQAMQGRWVQAPVLELHPRDPTGKVHHEVNKGGYVLLEEKAIRPHTAGEGKKGRPATKRKKAEDEIRKMIAEGIDVSSMGEKKLVKALEARGLEINARTAGRAKSSAMLAKKEGA